MTDDLHVRVLRIDKHDSGGQIKKNEIGGERSTCGERRGAYTVLLGRPQGTSPPGIPRRRRGDNIKTDVQEVGWGT